MSPDGALRAAGGPAGRSTRSYDAAPHADTRQRGARGPRARVDFARVATAALEHAPELLARWLPDGRRVGSEWVARNPRRDDRHAGSLAEVTSDRVMWLWDARVPRGKLTILDGDPGLGKSSVTLDLAARVSTGRAMPDGSPGVSGGVVLLSAEDGLADTIRPRLDAAGADVSRVVALSAIRLDTGERMPELPLDLAAIEAAIERASAVLVVVDPLMAYLGEETNSYRDQDVRRALAPMAALAERCGAAVVVVRHLRKTTGGPATHAGGGSIGIIGAARSGLLVARDPEDDDRRILAATKSNLGPPPAAGVGAAERRGVSAPGRG